MRFAIIKSQFNTEITSGLLSGAQEYLKEKDISPEQIHIFDAPGAFEIPLIARKLAQSKKFDGVICLGCVIKGETAHFEYISLASTIGLMQETLQNEIPITFGILTVYDRTQATSRSQKNSENKGREAAAACWETLQTLRKINDFS